MGGGSLEHAQRQSVRQLTAVSHLCGYHTHAPREYRAKPNPPPPQFIPPPLRGEVRWGVEVSSTHSASPFANPLITTLTQK